MSMNSQTTKIKGLMIITCSAILIWIIGYLLIAGKGLIMPIVIAIFIWHLVNTITNGILRFPVFGSYVPYWMGRILALIVLALLVTLFVNIIRNNVQTLLDALPRYQKNLSHIVNVVDTHLHIKGLVTLDNFLQNFNFQRVLINIYAVVTSITSSGVLISLYVIFLFVEQYYFSQKSERLLAQIGNRQLFNNMMSHITKDTQTYLGLKTFLGLGTATACWIIMKWVGLDFAEFWALLIFFLSFIPNIGPLVATLFPTLLALIQFQSWLPFLFLTLGIVSIQFIVGNLIEPRYLGKSLNLSALVILLALALWGEIWGILGMFLSVPITVMMMIIFAHFETTKPLAILLSQDGLISRACEKVNH